MIFIKNPGKLFEDDFKQSIDTDKVWIKRLNDNAASFANSSKTRFSSTNECDFLLFHDEYQKLFCLELKSTLDSLTFWRQEFEDEDRAKGKNPSYNIKKNQILGLQKWSIYNHTVCGFVFNFRDIRVNYTMFVEINDFIKYINKLRKKSINYKDVQNMNPIYIFGLKRRTRYRYDMENFFIKVMDEVKKSEVKEHD